VYSRLKVSCHKRAACDCCWQQGVCVRKPKHRAKIGLKALCSWWLWNFKLTIMEGMFGRLITDWWRVNCCCHFLHQRQIYLCLLANRANSDTVDLVLLWWNESHSLNSTKLLLCKDKRFSPCRTTFVCFCILMSILYIVIVIVICNCGVVSDT